MTQTKEDYIDVYNELKDAVDRCRDLPVTREIREHLEIALELLSDDIDDEFPEEEE